LEQEAPSETQPLQSNIVPSILLRSASQLVTEVLTQDMFSEAAQQSPREIRPDGQEALERARHQFEARQMPVAHPPAPSTNNK